MSRCMRSIGSFALVLAGGVLGAGCGAESAAELGAPEAGRCGQGSTEPECSASISAELGMGRGGEWRSVIMHGKNGPEEIHYQVINGLAVAQGDIILGKAEELESKGAGIKSRSLRWPDRHVPYLFDENLPEETQNFVNSAIAHWEENTDFDFELVAEPAPNTGTNYLRFTDSNICASYIGMQGLEQQVYLAKGRLSSEIVGMANYRADGYDIVMTYFRDGVMFWGSSTELDMADASVPYSLPPGYTPLDIVGMSMATSLGYVYTWYENGKYTIGDPYDLDSVQGPTDYTVASDQYISRIRGIGFAETGDPDDREVLVWYSNGKVSIGSPSDLDATSNGSIPFYLPPEQAPYHIVEMDTDIHNIVHAWFSDGTMYKGTFIYPYAFGTGSYSMAQGCSRGSVIHEIGHAIGLFHEQSRCDRDSHVDVHYENIIDDYEYAFDKFCLDRDLYAFDFSSIMLYGSFAYSVDPGDPTKATMRRADNNATFVAQRDGLSAGDLRSIKELYGYSPPVNKQPANIVAMARSSSGTIYTWYSDLTRTGGTTDDLDSAVASASYSVAPGKTVDQIVGMAFTTPLDRVYTWYSDGTASVGTTTNLGWYTSSFSYTVPSGKTFAKIVEIGMDPDGKVYTWYNDWSASKGTVTDLGFFAPSYGYMLRSGKTPAMIAGIDIASNAPTVYVWYTDFTFSSGSNTDFGSIQEAW
jgi:hypothetical protein